MTPAVCLDRVLVRIGRRVILEGISLEISAGEAVGIVGPNGAGKSTLVDVVLGLRAPDAGTVRVFGGTPPAPGVGFVPQDAGASLLPWYRIQDGVTMPLAIEGASASERARAFARVRELIDPEERIDPQSYPCALSGGERQKVALMRALVASPRFLICDEPFSAVDEQARAHLREVLASIRRSAGGPALLLVSHDARDLAELTARAFVLDGSPAASEESRARLARVRTPLGSSA